MRIHLSFSRHLEIQSTTQLAIQRKAATKEIIIENMRKKIRSISIQYNIFDFIEITPKTILPRAQMYILQTGP